MTLSPYITQRLGRSIACTVAVAAIAVPLAQATSYDDRPIVQAVSHEDRLESAQRYYVPTSAPDPWAYRIVHQAGKYGPLDSWAYSAVHAADKYGPLDPWATNVIRRKSLGGREATRGGVVEVGG